VRHLLAALLRAQGRPAGALLAAVLIALLLLTDFSPERALRHGLFDRYQRWQPRERVGDGVVIVEIDEPSLAELGQWPWPRQQVAQLVRQIAAQQPAVLGVDVLFVEPDRLSPQSLQPMLAEAGIEPAQLARLPDSDAQLAAALQSLPSVLGVGALGEATALAQGTPYRPMILQSGGDATRHAPPYAATLRSLESIDAAAAGHGVLNPPADGGIVRRVPTLVSIHGELLPGLATEILRLLGGDGVLRVQLRPGGIASIAAGGLRIPTDADGSWWLHFSRWTERPSVSAVDLLRGRVPPDLLRGRVVLLGYTALGLQDTVHTPLGLMPGVEVHAEALDNAIDGRLLRRPPWAPALEAALLALLAGLALATVPRLQPLRSAAAFAALALAVLAGGGAAFSRGALLIDTANPLAGSGLVFGLMLSLSLNQAQAQRRRLQEALMASREAQARLQGEFDAARRIQMGMLPLPQEVLPDERRVEVAARMQAARTVGGDLYDFYRLDDTRLLFMIGDVSGKGLPASLFMALCKALAKGVAPHAEGDPGRVLAATAAAIVGDNPEQLFVTMLVGVLDLDRGELAWCSAGHDAPYLLRADGRPPERLSGAGGPPLCVIDDFAYPVEHLQLAAGDLLCLITDGVTEAHNAAGELYGAPRLLRALADDAAQPSLESLADALLQDLGEFVGDAEPADDAALLLLRWRGDVGSGRRP